MINQTEKNNKIIKNSRPMGKYIGIFTALCLSTALIASGCSESSSSSATPSGSPASTQSATASTPETTDENASDALAKLAVKGRAPKTGYSRDQFSHGWEDVDHNGCDTRNDILNRDLTNKTYRKGTHDCIVLTGTLNDPYTGTTIDFQRGNDTSTKVQIDHIVALSDAWQTGAQQLTEDQRKNFPNDPYNLLAVQGEANTQKSDGDAATWLPGNKSYRCQYVARQIGVKYKYNLWVTQAEKDAMSQVLETCPAQKMPKDPGTVSDSVPYTQQSTQEESTPSQENPDASNPENNNSSEAPSSPAAPAPAPAPSAPAAPRKRTQRRTAPSAPQRSNVYYRNCAAARAAGAAPLYRGQPGYRPQLDRDGDGIACEK